VRRTSAALVLAVTLLAACDHGSVLLAENQTEEEFLARAVGSFYESSTGYTTPHEVMAILAPNSKLVVTVIPFRGGFQPWRVDILTPDCTLVDSVLLPGYTGTYVVINDDRRVELRKEFPQSGDAAETTDRCHSLPSPAPSQSPSRSPVATPSNSD